MRYKATFIAGFAAGFVIGTRAGRERYEQMEKMARGIAENPAVRETAAATVAGATGLAKTARDKAASKMPGMAETARHKTGGRLDRIPGLRGSGSAPGDHDGPGHQHAAPSPGSPRAYPDGT